MAEYKASINSRIYLGHESWNVYLESRVRRAKQTRENFIHMKDKKQ